jgi:hypothetical protein
MVEFERILFKDIAPYVMKTYADGNCCNIVDLIGPRLSGLLIFLSHLSWF